MGPHAGCEGHESAARHQRSATFMSLLFTTDAPKLRQAHHKNMVLRRISSSHEFGRSESLASQSTSRCQGLILGPVAMGCGCCLLLYTGISAHGEPQLRLSSTGAMQQTAGGCSHFMRHVLGELGESSTRVDTYNFFNI